jgi:hypothetical protein
MKVFSHLCYSHILAFLCSFKTLLLTDSAPCNNVPSGVAPDAVELIVLQRKSPRQAAPTICHRKAEAILWLSLYFCLNREQAPSQAISAGSLGGCAGHIQSREIGAPECACGYILCWHFYHALNLSVRSNSNNATSEETAILAGQVQRPTPPCNCRFRLIQLL